jgi:cytosine deaminase
LHSYNNPLAAKVIELCARAGLMVVTNPLDNIVLQGRYDRYPRRRGITRVDELWAAGVRVGIGHDSVVDPWYRLGTANLLDPAWMLLHVGHLTSQEQMARIVTTLHRENHQIFGDVAPLVENAPATFQWYPCDDPIELLRTRPKPRVFFRGAEVSVPMDGETGVR